MDCVKCGAELTGSEVECPGCGVIVSKARSAPLPTTPAHGQKGIGPRPEDRKYHYLVEPFHGNIRAGQGIQEVSSQLHDLINHYAAYGWEFVQVGSVSLTVNEGCVSAFLGRGTSQHSYDQVVFRKAVEPDVEPEKSSA
jgi:hypothetical protein